MGNKQEIKEYKTAIEAALKTQFPEHDITVFKRIDDIFNLPAIIVNPPIMEPVIGGPISKGKLTVNLKNSAFVCYSVVDEENEYNCIQVSAYLGNFIKDNTWGLKIMPAKVSIIEPTIIEGLESLVIQRVDFEQHVTITETN